MNLPPAKSLPISAALLILTACATIAPPQPPSLDLPKPPSDLRATRKGNHVILTWTAPTVTTDRQTIHRLGATQICRAIATQLVDCGAPVGEVANASSSSNSASKLTRTYTDSLPAQLESGNSSAVATYAVEVLNPAGRGAGPSNQVRIALGRALPPPQDFAARVIDKGVLLTWTNDIGAPSAGERFRYVYRVYRRQEGSSEQVLVGEVPRASEHELSLTDSSMEWEKTYEYHAETVTLVAADSKPEVQIEGDDTPEIKVFVNDVFPPAVPSGLQAVASGPGQQNFIDLVWGPVPDVDLAGYNVYRHEEGMPAVKVNTELAKAPAYRDTSVNSGKRYFYSVSSVDLRGNESARSEETNEMVP